MESSDLLQFQVRTGPHTLKVLSKYLFLNIIGFIYPLQSATAILSMLSPKLQRYTISLEGK